MQRQVGAQSGKTRLAVFSAAVHPNPDAQNAAPDTETETEGGASESDGRPGIQETSPTRRCSRTRSARAPGRPGGGSEDGPDTGREAADPGETAVDADEERRSAGDARELRRLCEGLGVLPDETGPRLDAPRGEAEAS
eukprot:scaffold1237_cov243-Pinguiococcus_pyrenoidosus.AAC.23